MNSSLWDMAGVDGLAVAKHVFGDEVGYLAPFQSMETVLEGKDCSVLRLCDRNFRIAYSGSLYPLVEPLQANIWLNQFDWLASLSLPMNVLPHIISQATARPPHRLKNLPNHQAVPAQLHRRPILLWRHPYHGQIAIDLHVARKDLEHLAASVAEMS